jgi:hypothetical protein
MYLKLPQNIIKRYIYITHQCLRCLSEPDKDLIQKSGNINIKNLFSNPNFNIFISYIDDLLNRKKLNTNKAKLIFLFLDNIIYEHNKKDPFYIFYKKNNSNLIRYPSFLSNFLLSETNKVISYNYTNEQQEKLNKALNLISSYLPNCFKNKIIPNCRYVNIENEYGCINSLTITKCYDLIFLTLNNPQFLIIEQIIHEQTHINFGLLIEMKKYEHLFNKPYSAYSPFAKKVRPIEYIANGYCAFIAVLNLYKYFLKNFEKIKFQFEISDKKTIQNRINTLLPRIKEAEVILDGIFENNLLWARFKKEFLFEFKTNNQFIKNRKYKFNRELTNIQNAEILLGLYTDKIARITIPISQTIDIYNLLPVNNYYFSNDAFVESRNEDIETFSNVHENIGSHINSTDDKNTFVNCYIGKNKQKLKKAVYKDQFDSAGDYFKIPKCCQSHFKLFWNKIIKHYNGDYVKFLLDKVNHKDTYKWQTNALGMYFDAGYTWHFPCNFNCKKTIRIIEKRYEDLQKINKKLAQVLKREAIGSFSQLHNNNYLREFRNIKKFTSTQKKVSIIKTLIFIK